MRSIFRACLFSVCAIGFGTGCDPYLAHLVEGQLASLERTVPIEEALNDPNLTDAEKAKLALVPSIRQFAIDELGLSPGDAYTVFEANGSTPAAYVVAGSRKDRLQPYVWFYPFVGFTPVKGYFDEQLAEAEADLLRQQGFDVLLANADGFSTLGFFADPVRQSNLVLNVADFAELLIHEMTHTTFFAAGDADYNESVATFTGREGALRWMRATYGADSEIVAAAVARFADKAVLDAYVVDLSDRARAFYRKAEDAGQSMEQILIDREGLFAALAGLFDNTYRTQLNTPEAWQFAADQTLNNAIILAGVRYQSGLALYADVLEILNGDYPAMIQVFAEAANQPNSREYLQNWVAERR